MANVEDSLEFLLQRSRVIKLRLLPGERVACGRLETALMSSFDLPVRQGYLPTKNAAGS
jgi:hypothetical protein